MVRGMSVVQEDGVGSVTSTRPTVSFLGPLGTYSHQAAGNLFGSDTTYLPQEKIIDVFDSVQNFHSHYGVVPIENSSIGPVAETTEALRSTTLCVRSMTALKIGHALLSKRHIAPADVKRVYSHEQGIGQCVGYLSLHYPKAQVVPVSSTAQAASEAFFDEASLAICSIKCAEVYNLEVIDKDIQDGGIGNTTRFVVISQASKPLPSKYPVTPWQP